MNSSHSFSLEPGASIVEVDDSAVLHVFPLINEISLKGISGRGAEGRQGDGGLKIK